MEQSNTNDFNRLSISEAAHAIRFSPHVKDGSSSSQKSKQTLSTRQELDPRFIVLKSNLNPKSCSELHELLAQHGGDPLDRLN